MIHISDQQSWHSRAPGRRLDNQVVVMDHDGEALLLAVGGPRQWASGDPLPDGARIVDLTALATHDPTEAARLWVTFVRYLHHAAGASFLDSALMLLGLGRIKVHVAVSDPQVRESIVAALGTAKGLKLVSTST